MVLWRFGRARRICFAVLCVALRCFVALLLFALHCVLFVSARRQVTLTIIIIGFDRGRMLHWRRRVRGLVGKVAGRRSSSSDRGRCAHGWMLFAFWFRAGLDSGVDGAKGGWYCGLHSLSLLLLGFGLGSTRESMAPRVEGLVSAMEGGTFVVAHALHSLHIHSLDTQSLHTHRDSLSPCLSLVPRCCLLGLDVLAVASFATALTSHLPPSPWHRQAYRQALH